MSIARSHRALRDSSSTTRTLRGQQALQLPRVLCAVHELAGMVVPKLGDDDQLILALRHTVHDEVIVVATRGRAVLRHRSRILQRHCVWA